MRFNILLFAILLVAACTSRATVASGTFPEGVGSNYVFHDLGKYATDQSSASWESDVKVTLTHYHTYQNEIRQRLKDMRAAGQTKLSLVLWYVEEGQSCETFAHYICPKDGKIPAQVESNMKNMLKDVADAGFDTTIVRMAAQGQADPLAKNYNSARANDSWKLFENVYATSESAIKDSKMRVLYDLGLETMGHPQSSQPGAMTFLNTMWGNYVKKYPANKTVGFSFNHAHGDNARKSLEVYKRTGVWPEYIAIDIYEDPKKYLKALADALKKLKKSGHPIIITETFNNSPELAKEFEKYKKQYGLNFRSILQWPLRKGGGKHSDSPLTTDISAYLSKEDLSALFGSQTNAPSTTKRQGGADGISKNTKANQLRGRATMRYASPVVQAPSVQAPRVQAPQIRAPSSTPSRGIRMRQMAY